MEQAVYNEIDGEIMPPEAAIFEELPDSPAKYSLEDDKFYMVRARDSREALLKPFHDLGIFPTAENFKETQAALLDGAAMYASRARAKGLRTRYETPIGKRLLEKRYNGQADNVVSGCEKNTAYTYDDERRTLAPAVGVDGEKWVQQELPPKKEEAALLCLIGIRRAIGIDVGAKERDKIIRLLKRSHF